MRRVYFIAGLVMMLITWLFLWKFYPKNLGMIWGLGLLYILDLYLYWVYQRTVWSRGRIRGILFTVLFWTPLLMIMLMAAVSLVYPYQNWPVGIRNYYAGFILSGYVAKMIPLLIQLLTDLWLIIRKLFRYRRRRRETKEGPVMKRSEFLKKAGLAAGGLVFGTMTLGMFKWVYEFKIHRIPVSLKDLPRSFDGFRIVQISDIHLGSWVSRNEFREAVRQINSLKPDIIVFTGDLVNYSTDEAYRFADLLEEVGNGAEVYAILGNHDYGDYKRWPSAEEKERNFRDLVLFYEQLGWTLLRNENRLLRRGEDTIALLGVENWGSMKRFQRFGDLGKAMAGTEEQPVRILLSHDPSHWRYKVLDHPVKVDLTLSGHTHGAQFGIEIPGVRWSPSKYIYKFWAGLYSRQNRENGEDQYLYVNRGLGAIGYPGRVGILPEITLLELSKS